MKQTYIYILISLFFMACGSEPQVQNEISMEDFMGETGEEIFIEETQNTLIIEPVGEINVFINNQLSVYDTNSHTKFHPIDRFTYNQRKKITFKSKTNVKYENQAMVTPQAELYYYSFEDTTKTKNAFYNWLDCYSDECEMIKINEEYKALKTPPQFTLVYDTVIVVVDYRCEDQNYNWKPFQDSITKRFGKNYKHSFKVGCGGSLKWK